MYTVLEGMRKVAVHLWPVMPAEAQAMLAQLGQTADPAGISLPGELASWGDLVPGTEVAKTSNLFPRIEADREVPEKARPKAKPAEKPAVKEPAPGLIDFEDFQKMDLRVGLVISAECVPQADKLLLVKVDLGEAEPRQVVAGLAQFWKPADLVGRQVVLVANLKPRKLRGVESQGMILAVRREEGLELLTATDKVIPGSKVS
jgi:methionyl-tRNA synthetase